MSVTRLPSLTQSTEKPPSLEFVGVAYSFFRNKVVSCFRDTLVYAMSASMEGLPHVTELLSEVVLSPRITEEEV